MKPLTISTNRLHFQFYKLRIPSNVLQVNECQFNMGSLKFTFTWRRNLVQNLSEFITLYDKVYLLSLVKHRFFILKKMVKSFMFIFINFTYIYKSKILSYIRFQLNYVSESIYKNKLYF